MAGYAIICIIARGLAQDSRNVELRVKYPSGSILLNVTCNICLLSLCFVLIAKYGAYYSPAREFLYKLLPDFGFERGARAQILIWGGLAIAPMLIVAFLFSMFQTSGSESEKSSGRRDGLRLGKSRTAREHKQLAEKNHTPELEDPSVSYSTRSYRPRVIREFLEKEIRSIGLFFSAESIEIDSTNALSNNVTVSCENCGRNNQRDTLTCAAGHATFKLSFLWLLIGPLLFLYATIVAVFGEARTEFWLIPISGLLSYLLILAMMRQFGKAAILRASIGFFIFLLFYAFPTLFQLVFIGQEYPNSIQLLRREIESLLILGVAVAVALTAFKIVRRAKLGILAATVLVLPTVLLLAEILVALNKFLNGAEVFHYVDQPTVRWMISAILGVIFFSLFAVILTLSIIRPRKELEMQGLLLPNLYLAWEFAIVCVKFFKHAIFLTYRSAIVVAKNYIVPYLGPAVIWGGASFLLLHLGDFLTVVGTHIPLEFTPLLFGATAVTSVTLPILVVGIAVLVSKEISRTFLGSVTSRTFEIFCMAYLILAVAIFSSAIWHGLPIFDKQFLVHLAYAFLPLVVLLIISIFSLPRSVFLSFPMVARVVKFWNREGAAT